MLGNIHTVDGSEIQRSPVDMVDMDVSENSGTSKSSILIGFSIINHPFWGTPIFGNTHIISTIKIYKVVCTIQKRRGGWPW